MTGSATHSPTFDENAGRMQEDLRPQVSAALLGRTDAIAADTTAVFPYCGSEALDPDYCSRVGHVLIRLLASTIRAGRLDPRGASVADLQKIVLERALTIERLFTFVYLTERVALDELSLHEDVGSTSERWPLVAQLVRRGSFDVLAAFAERAQPSD